MTHGLTVIVIEGEFHQARHHRTGVALHVVCKERGNISTSAEQ